MASISALNFKLQNIKVSSGFDKLVSETSNIASAVQALNSTSLGGILNETVSGIQALNTTVNAATAIATLTGNIPGIQDQIIKDVSQSKAALDAICGTTNDNGFLDVVITCPTPEGVKAATSAIATVTDNKHKLYSVTLHLKSMQIKYQRYQRKTLINLAENILLL